MSKLIVAAIGSEDIGPTVNNLLSRSSLRLTDAVGPRIDAALDHTCNHFSRHHLQVDHMKVLIAVDDKTYGIAMANFLVQTRWRKTPAFKIVNVVPSTKYLIPSVTGVSDLRYIEALEDRRQAGRNLIFEVGNALGQSFPNSSIQGLVADGDPRAVICDMALEWQASMIVMGSHSRTGFKRILLGSVSSSVLSHASCSVTIVRLGKTDKGEDRPRAQDVATQSIQLEPPAR